MNYSFSKIDKKWQRFWEKKGIFKTKNDFKKSKFYILDMFPYPSGEGLHVGHIRGYIATDILSRVLKMKGRNVLHPMGFDAFGLPAENYALSHKIHPQIAVERNIKNFKKQMKKIGLNYDWDREINTTDPNYYRWTQWIFLKMFEKGLAKRSLEPVNWCPGCKTALANEDLEGNRCERCGRKVLRKKLAQWILKITNYSEKLLKGLKYLNWPSSIKLAQKNWIGKSEGAVVKFKISNTSNFVEVFTTRLDTIFGSTYVVLAPENKILKKLKEKIKNWQEIKRYLKEAENKLDLERMMEKEKRGILVKGIKAINPLNGEEIPIFVADYVLGYYGTGAIMAVPGHDLRDFEFAKKHHLKIVKVIRPKKGKDKECFEEDGILINSGAFTGLSSAKAREKILNWLQRRGLGRKEVFYRMRDWVFSRQRYWGEPIPLVYCENCRKRILKGDFKKNEFNKGELLNPGWIALPYEKLPLKLPQVSFYQPTGRGESPLANIKSWTDTYCPKCRKRAKRETNTMPQWAGSCWYYLRYIDPQNKKALISKRKEKYWMPVDLYVGGAEHATRHLIYARFWHRFLYELKIVSTKEPFKKLKNVGLILASDGRKMSKRWKNVISPDEIIEKYGADVLRVYEMFLGPFSESVFWKEEGILGIKRFLDRVFSLKEKLLFKKPSPEIKKIAHSSIKKVTEDIFSFKFNTAISKLMIFLNKLEKEPNLWAYKIFIKLLAPFAPHLAEEIFHLLTAKKSSIFEESWPRYRKSFTQEEKFVLIVQINGKMRDKLEAPLGISQKEAKKLALSLEKIKKHLSRKKIKRVVFVKNRVINFVI